MGWKAIARYDVGTSHQSQELPCQDYGDYGIFQDVIVGVVADGAGSAKYSDVGSELAVKTVIDWFERVNKSSEQQEFSQSLSQIETEKVFARIVQEVIAELRQLASEKDYAFNDLACTLLVFIATPHWLGAMQIGDGFIVVRPQDSEDYQLLFQPDKGEFANETTFITSKDALAEMQVKVISEPQKFICASTDGLEKLAIRISDWKPFPPFFKPFEEYLEETANPEDEAEYLVNFLKSERLNARTDDDKTLLLCLWENN